MRRARWTLPLAAPLLALPLAIGGACAGLAPALGATAQATAANRATATGQVTVAGQASAAAAATPPAHYAAPYLQITSGRRRRPGRRPECQRRQVLHARLPDPAVRLHPRMGRQRRRGRGLHLASELAHSRRRHRDHLLRRGDPAANSPRPAPRYRRERGLRQRGEHLRRRPARLRHRGQARSATPPRTPAATRPWPRCRRPTRRSRSTSPSPGDPTGLPSARTRRAAERPDLRRQGQRGQHHDDGLRQRPEPAVRRRVRGPGDRVPAGQPLRRQSPARRTPGWG